MSETTPLSDLRVLLIEDAPATAAVLQLYLEEMGISDAHWVETLSDAQALGTRIEAGHFDVILSDLILDDDDAGDFLSSVTTTAGCPIIVCSGCAGSTDRSDLKSHTFLPKPVSFSALETTLNALRNASATIQ